MKNKNKALKMIAIMLCAGVVTTIGANVPTEKLVGTAEISVLSETAEISVLSETAETSEEANTPMVISTQNSDSKYGNYVNRITQVKVNDIALSGQEFEERFQNFDEFYTSKGIDFNSSGMSIVREKIFQHIKVKMIDEARKYYLCKNLNILPNDALLMDNMKVLGLTDKQNSLYVNKFVLDQTINSIIEETFYTKLKDATDEQVKKYYEENIDAYSMGKTGNLNAIYLEDENIAKTVISKIKAGEDFATLAGQYSVDKVSKNYGGDLGQVDFSKFYADSESVQKALNDATGDTVTDILKVGENQFIILKISGVQEAYTFPYEDVAATVKEDYIESNMKKMDLVVEKLKLVTCRIVDPEYDTYSEEEITRIIEKWKKEGTQNIKDEEQVVVFQYLYQEYVKTGELKYFDDTDEQSKAAVSDTKIDE